MIKHNQKKNTRSWNVGVIAFGGILDFEFAQINEFKILCKSAE